MTSKITATCELNRQQLTNVPVVNPGDCLGKTWLLEIGGSVSPLFLIVEADGPSDAIDELADSELMVGKGTAEVAEKFGVTAGAVSQFRARFKRLYDEFFADHAEACVAAS